MKLDSRHMSGVSLQGDIAAIELNNVFQFIKKMNTKPPVFRAIPNDLGHFHVGC